MQSTETEEKDIIKEANALGFDNLNIVQKINAVDRIIDDKIRDFLHADGGDLDFIELRETNELTDVYISYVGACGSCESSGGTLVSIQRILNGQLETDKIRVYAV